MMKDPNIWETVANLLTVSRAMKGIVAPKDSPLPKFDTTESPRPAQLTSDHEPCCVTKLGFWMVELRLRYPNGVLS